LQGERPCRERANHPPVSSVALTAEPKAVGNDILQKANKVGEAYTENCAGRREFAAPESWYSFEMQGSTRVLTYTEVYTEASEMVRMWRISGVIRLWHVQTDAYKNLGAPSRPCQETKEGDCIARDTKHGGDGTALVY